MREERGMHWTRRRLHHSRATVERIDNRSPGPSPCVDELLRFSPYTSGQWGSGETVSMATASGEGMRGATADGASITPSRLARARPWPSHSWRWGWRRDRGSASLCSAPPRGTWGSPPRKWALPVLIKVPSPSVTRRYVKVRCHRKYARENSFAGEFIPRIPCFEFRAIQDGKVQDLRTSAARRLIGLSSGN